VLRIWSGGGEPERLESGINSQWVKNTNMTDSDPELVPDPDPLVRGTDPDPHQKVTDPQHWLSSILLNQLCFVGVQPRGLRGGGWPEAQPADEQGAPHPRPPPLGRSGSLLLPSPQEGEGQCLPGGYNEMSSIFAYQ
jgi:hypothetical protein